MSKLFVLSNVFHRYRHDFFPCGTHVRRDPCDSCGVNLNGWTAPLQYWWEYEFGDPQSSCDSQHNCFWGGFRMMVGPAGKALLETLNIPFRFHPTKMTEGPILFEEQSSLACVTIDSYVNADAVACKNEVCSACGRFKEHRRQITRLRIASSVIPDFGVFKVRQNGETGPMFVTEAARETLNQTGITGIGYYPAGRVIGSSPTAMPRRS